MERSRPSFRAESADATLAEIAAGRATPWFLPWIPLLKGARKTTIVGEWKTLAEAEAEPDARTRAVFDGLALVFATLTRHAGIWRRGLEGWNMNGSPIVAGWRAETSQANILQILEVRFPGKIPAKLVAVVKSQSDLTILSRWVIEAVTTPSPVAYLAASGIGRSE